MPEIVAERAGARRLLLASASRAAARLSGCYVMQAAAGPGRRARAQRADRAGRRRSGDTGAGGAGPARAGVAGARVRGAGTRRCPMGRSFRNYADLGRPYAVWNVVAAPEFSVSRGAGATRWRAASAYRGLLRRGPGRSHGAPTRAGAATTSTVGGVATYSTLGHLPDPVFNTMLGWRETRLRRNDLPRARARATVCAGDSEFNEAFASVVEQEGVRRWLQARGRTASSSATALRCAREAEFAALLRAARERLRRLYASGARRAQLASRQAAGIRSAQVRVHAVARALGRLRRLRRLVRAPAQQRAPRGRGDLSRLRAGAAARARGGGIAAAFYARAEELARCRCGAACGGVRVRSGDGQG